MIKKFEKFNPYDDEPLSRVEQQFGKQTRLEKQFSKIVVNGLIDDDTLYWSTFNALKIELKNIIGDDILYQEFMSRIVEGENPTDVVRNIYKKAYYLEKFKSLIIDNKELTRLLGKLRNV